MTERRRMPGGRGAGGGAAGGTPAAPPSPLPAAGQPANRLYVVATFVPRLTTLRVGALGEIELERGWYAYVGSARRGRTARVARHLCAGKRLRWHADFLFCRHPAAAAWTLDTDLGECALAETLMSGLPGARRAIRGFGSSDCRCPGHLVAHPGPRSQLEALLARLGATRYPLANR